MSSSRRYYSESFTGPLDFNELALRVSESIHSEYEMFPLQAGTQLPPQALHTPALSLHQVHSAPLFPLRPLGPCTFQRKSCRQFSPCGQRHPEPGTERQLLPRCPEPACTALHPSLWMDSGDREQIRPRVCQVCAHSTCTAWLMALP